MVHEELWKALLAAEPDDVCRRSLAQFEAASGAYIMDMLAKTYVVRPKERVIEILTTPPSKVTDIHVYVSAVQYLLNAKDVPRTGEWVTEKQLSYGDFFFTTPHPLPTAKILKRFGTDPDAFARACVKLGGEKLTFGDVSFELRVLPRLPLAYVLWRADDEFPARCQILFDSTAEEHLPVDALWSAMHLVSTELLAAT